MKIRIKNWSISFLDFYNGFFLDPQLITEDVLKQIIPLTTEYSSLILRIVYCLSEINYFHFKLVQAGVLEEMFSHVQGMSPKDLEPTKEMNMNFGEQVFYGPKI